MLRRVGTEGLSTYFLAYMPYNASTGMYEHLIAQDGFAPFGQRETLIPYMQMICSVGARV